MLATVISIQAQGGSNLGLVINVPSNMLSCEATSVQWIWTGSTADADGRTLSMAVEQVGSNNRRSFSEPSPIRHIHKRSESKRMTLMRRAAINIAGGNNVPVTAGSWTWNSVGVPVGTYRMALVLEPDSIVFFSDHFTVSQGPDISCLGSLGTTSASAAISTVLPALSMAAPTSTVNSSQATTTMLPSPVATASSSIVASVMPPATSQPQSNAHSSADDQSSHHHISGGAIAAAVIIPLLVLGVIIYLCCMRRQNGQGASDTSPSAKEKVASFFNGAASKYNRQIGTPMDPIHTAGHTRNDSALHRDILGADQDEKIMSPSAEHWVDFNPDSPEHDAAIVTSERVDAMVRESMDGRDAQAFYQLGQNKRLRQSGMSAVNRDTVLSDTSSMPTYLREADFTSQHTHSSFGHDQNGNAVGHVPNAQATETQASPLLERGNSKIRRKPAPTYSTYSTAGITKRTVALESLEVPLPDSSVVEAQSPFSDDNRVNEKTLGTQEEVMEDSPTLPQERTPVNSSRSFPVSVYSTNIDSPSQRILLETPRELLSEEERSRLYKLSIQMPQEERGFRVSF